MGEPFQLGRYALHAELAAGGMAAVYLARQAGPVGFGKTVAIKRLHPHLARDSYFATMFLDEARLAARITHPNVVPILDVVSTESELFLVLEYVRGETLSGLLRASRKKGTKIPIPIAAAIIVGLLSGLHAAHEAHDEQGKPLHIVHRDVSPQNLIVGADGVARVLDFGVAKAATRLQTTREGQLKGKIPYMSPEQLSGEVTARSDVYSAALVLWEALTCQRLLRGETEAQILHLAMTIEAAAPSTVNPEVPPALDAVVLKGLARDPNARYTTARDMAAAIEAATPVATTMKVAEWVESLIGTTLAARDAIRAEIESGSHARDPLGPPLSTPALPGFPQVADASAPSMPSFAGASFPGSSPGIAESTASLVVANHAPARSRWPLVAALIGVGGLAIAALAIGIAYGRSSPNATNAATGTPPSVSSAPPVSAAPAPSATTPATASAAPSAAPPQTAPVATAHHHVRSLPTHAASTVAQPRNPNDIDSLLDTR